MMCDKKIKPEFTAEQQAECEKCRHISGKKTWCCLFGAYIDGRLEIVRPSKRIIQPGKRIRKPVTGTKYAKWMAENRFK